jgi:DNA-binding NarL/FixJ family response regulator
LRPGVRVTGTKSNGGPGRANVRSAGNGRGHRARCVIADDHPAMLEAMEASLAHLDVDVVGRAATGAEALALIDEHRPALALLDVRMPRGSGVEVARAARQMSPETAIVLYTAFADPATLVEAFDLGVRGFVLKEAPLLELGRAILTVLDDGVYVDPALASVLVRSGGGRISALSDREREVLRLVADGLSNGQIGGKLFISPETVRTHLRSAMSKLDADNRTHAVASALRASIIE